MKHQEFRKLLEKTMERTYSDNAARTLRKRIIEAGWDDSDLPHVISLIKENTVVGGRVTSIPSKLNEEEGKQITNKFKNVKASEFIREVNNFLGAIAPKERKHPTGKIYPSTQWYKWFKDCDASLNLNGIYPPDVYLRVLNRVRAWADRKNRRANK